MPVDSCDPDLIASLVRSGSPDALDRIARCYGERLLAVGLRQCRLPVEAEDAVQDALLLAGEHLTDYRGEGSVEAWVSVMVSRACARMRRGRKNDPALHTSAVEPPARRPDPEDLAAQRELVGVVLAGLGPEDTRLLWMADVEGRKAPEIAALEGLSAAAVRARLSRARRRVRPQLAATLQVRSD